MAAAYAVTRTHTYVHTHTRTRPRVMCISYRMPARRPYVLTGQIYTHDDDDADDR